MAIFKNLPFILLFILVINSHRSSAQFYNKEVAAKILIVPGSEFLTLKAGVENKTKSDLGLTYEYSIFTTNQDSTVSKSSDKNRFFIQSSERKIVNQLTLNYNFTKKTILLLIIYDENEKPIGKDRVILDEGGQTDLKELLQKQEGALADRAAPQDGYVNQGFVLQKSITKSGRDFFRYFHSQYLNTQVSTDKTILIQETFGRGRNTRIIVKVEDRIVHQFFAQPRKEFLTQQADFAFRRVLLQLDNLKKQKEQFIRY